MKFHIQYVHTTLNASLSLPLLFFFFEKKMPFFFEKKKKKDALFWKKGMSIF